MQIVRRSTVFLKKKKTENLCRPAIFSGKVFFVCVGRRLVDTHSLGHGWKDLSCLGSEVWRSQEQGGEACVRG